MAAVKQGAGPRPPHLGSGGPVPVRELAFLSRAAVPGPRLYTRTPAPVC